MESVLKRHLTSNQEHSFQCCYKTCKLLHFFFGNRTRCLLFFIRRPLTLWELSLSEQQGGSLPHRTIKFKIIRGLTMNFTFQKCDQSADCKNAQYCDAFLRVCRERLGDGAACTQKDQCEGKYRCTWGRCIKNSEEGSSGQSSFV